jgi:intracellular sulfur oxidation DsrE/DsrF family protein
MKTLKRIFAAVAALAAMMVFVEPLQAADTAGGRYRVVFQISDNDPAKWNLALNNVRNIQQDLGRENVDIEVVAYGPGLNMLKLDSAVAARVGEALGSGAGILACENTMTNTKTSRSDMLPNIGYVKAGVTALMMRQREGWAYIRP